MAVKKKQASGNEVPEWVVTYGDLMSLLLCFFILLAAFSELKKEHEYIKVLESIREALGYRGGSGRMDSDASPTNSNVSAMRELARMKNNSQDTNVNWDQNVTGHSPKTPVITDGQRIAVGAAVPFDEGDFELSRVAQDLLKTDVAPKIRDQNFIVFVEGHAWGDTEKTSGFSLDQLAFRRADAVKTYLVRECGVDQMILRVVSAGVTEPRSISATQVETPLTNRRVQIWQTGRTVDQAHPDPNYTAAATATMP